MKLTCTDIITPLMDWISSAPSDVVLPNYYHRHFECDVYRLQKNGIEIEYEIKVTRADFKADFAKSVRRYNPQIGKNETLLKHDMIPQVMTTNRFYFVVPKDMVKPEEVPVYAGLIYAEAHEHGMRFKIVKNARLVKKETKDYMARLHDLVWTLGAREKRFRSELVRARFKIHELTRRK